MHLRLNIQQILTALVALVALLPVGATAQSRMPKLAPGVLKTIPGFPEEAETVTGPKDLLELSTETKAWKPNYIPENQTLAELASSVVLRRPVWQLEFSFKPMRLLTITGPDGSARRVWYLVYKVTNTGRHLLPVAEKDKFGNDFFQTKAGTKNVRFFPLFVLRAHEFDKSYSDRIIAGVKSRIHRIEIKDPNVTLHDSVSITKVAIEPNSETVDRGVWGVATWPAVDRRTDFFSVYVQGLSNAYKWDAQAGNATGLTYKTLQLNFWRPGDPVLESEKEFRYGIPSLPGDPGNAKVKTMYNMQDMAEYAWLFQQ